MTYSVEPNGSAWIVKSDGLPVVYAIESADGWLVAPAWAPEDDLLIADLDETVFVLSELDYLFGLGGLASALVDALQALADGTK